ncbi:hypothetical protein BJV82DRAFT_581257 [Fennellomyces sp. T-0311]|nr:hypothetical protein BJV82DRAFT_581257 [Fennellomyces sp. T-0311]
MPEAEFAHNAFFSLHRPLLGLSSDEERPFFSTATRHHTPNDIQKMLGIDQSAEDTEDMNDEAVTQYMMQLRPFEPPLSPSNEQVEDQETVVTLSFEDGHSAYDEIEAIHMDQSMPMYYMPESHEVVDYLTAMQEKLQYEEEREENGRRRGSNRPLVHAATAAEARRRTMSIQQYRQRTRRQRPIAMIDRKHHK